MFDLNDKSVCVFGLPNAGKSTLTNYILSGFGPLAFIYDTLNEYPCKGYDGYVPRNRESVPEVEAAIRQVMKSRKYRLLVIDEANRYAPSKPAPLPQAFADLNDWRAHYSLSTIYIARKPTQLNQDLTDLANYLIIFSSPGPRVTRFLNDMYPGLGDAGATLPPYHFIVYTQGQGYQSYNPIPREYATNKKL